MSNTIGIHEPQYSGYTQEERDEAERLQARLSELVTQASQRLKNDEGLNQYDARKCHEVARQIKALRLSPGEFRQMCEDAQRQLLYEGVKEVMHYGEKHEAQLAFITKRAWPSATTPRPTTDSGSAG